MSKLLERENLNEGLSGDVIALEADGSCLRVCFELSHCRELTGVYGDVPRVKWICQAEWGPDLRLGQ